MGKKTVDDYLTQGMYGVRRPKEHEREYFLGTLRERIVLALTIGQVMSDSGIQHLEQAMREHPKARLILNGEVAGKFLKQEKNLAKKYNIPYSILSNQESKTDIGAVLTYDHAIDKEEIFVQKNKIEEKDVEDKQGKSSFFSKVKQWFS